MLLVVLLAFVGCSKDDMSGGSEADKGKNSIPHLFGTMLPEDQNPTTRGVADNLKLWNKSVFQQGLTVKFLSNPSPEYIEFVKSVAKEWEAVANVKFDFVESNQEAIIRIGFDKVRYMNASWAYTGTDHLKVSDQSKPTVNYSNWLNLSSERKRNDVLRTFGQILGLELEYRHPDFDPGWARLDDGTIDEEEIRLYWQNQLSNYISWADLKKIVLEPLSKQTNNISKTKEYDSNSIMTWLLPVYIANNTALPAYNDPIITELSTQDKNFIISLYGHPEGPVTEVFNKLIEFDYTGKNPVFQVTSTKNLSIQWDSATTGEYVTYVIPTGAKLPYTFTINNSFITAKTRRIAIGEVLLSNESTETSSLITRFDLKDKNDAKNFKIKNSNHALTYVRINGSPNGVSQTFDFTGNVTIKELYLINIENSKVILNGCSDLEVFSTTTTLDPIARPLGYNSKSVAENSPILYGDKISNKSVVEKWPYYPEPKHSLSDGCLTIRNCCNLRLLGLENTMLTNLDLSNLPKLELVYLSSFSQYIAGGSSDAAGLKSLINTLNDRKNRPDMKRGSLVIQQVVNSGTPNSFSNYAFTTSNISNSDYNVITSMLADKNWDFFNAGERLQISLSEGAYGSRLYYKYLNPKIKDLEYEVLITRVVNGKNDLVLYSHNGHYFDENGRPYYSVNCVSSGGSEVSYIVGLKVGVGPDLEFSNSWIDLQEIILY